MINQEKASDYKNIEKIGYSYLSRGLERWKNYLYFSDSGKERFAHTVGYIQGVHQSGNIEFAEALSYSFIRSLDCLVGSVENPVSTNISFANDPKEYQVIPRKCILWDDGTFGGFSLAWYNVVSPIRVEQSLEKNNYVLSDVIRELKITTNVDASNRYSDSLTGYVWSKATDSSKEIFYSYVYNGGLLYHGPNGGEVFSVTLERNPLWSVHT